MRLLGRVARGAVKVLLVVAKFATLPVWLPLVVFIEVCVVGGFCDG